MRLDYLSSPIYINTVVQVLPFSSLIKLNRKSATAVYQQLSGTIVNLIHDGILQPGAAIPSSREMASILGLHRKTIIAAYEELMAQDWIISVPRKGMRVAANLPELKPRSFKSPAKTAPFENKNPLLINKTNIIIPNRKNNYRFVINDGFPDARIAPFDALLRQYRFFLKRPASESYTMYGNIAGTNNFRNALAVFLSETRGLNINEDNVLVTRGAQMAIYLAASMLIKPGARVVVAEPNYGMANNIFEQFGARLVKVPVDTNGINVEEIEKLCKKNKPDMMYIIPHHHHPTTVTLSAARRMKLLSLIREYKIPVIEDDYDYDFHYARNPILPLASADHGGYVFYIGSVTKTLSASVRVGYLISTADFIQRTAAHKRLIDISGDVLLEESLAILFKNGEMQKHLKKSVKIYQQRRDSFCELLQAEFEGKLFFTKPTGGMSVWVEFLKKYPLKEIAAKAASLGLYMNDGSGYNTDKTDYNALRMGFASFNEKEMKAVIAILKKCLPPA